jgi:hypothetical protein
VPSEKASLIIKDILESSLTQEDMSAIFDAARDKSREIRNQKGREAALKLRPGLKVGFGKKDSFGRRSYKEGVIVKLNQTRALVKVGAIEWAVPFAMLTILDQRKQLSTPESDFLDAAAEARAEAQAEAEGS